MLYTMRYDSLVGELLLAEQDGALAGLWIRGQKYFPESWQKDMREKPDSKLLNQTKDWLDRQSLWRSDYLRRAVQEDCSQQRT